MLLRLARWLPWRPAIRSLARASGFVDPINILSTMGRFAQPSEVGAPMELVRAGVIFHARGLINTKAIQSNLDWVWPYWVRRQFDPRDESFIPRSFSITHINLTHRNWTAVGVPDCEAYPIIDPRGLVTPFYDGWSLDLWVIPHEGEPLLPSRLLESNQRLLLEEDNIAIESEHRRNGCALNSRADVTRRGEDVQLHLMASAISGSGGWLVLSARPYNPEGISFINRISLRADHQAWAVNRRGRVLWHETPDKVLFSTYHDGDVFFRLNEEEKAGDRRIQCPVGMATSAAMFALEPGQDRELKVTVPLGHDPEFKRRKLITGQSTWRSEVEDTARIDVPDERLRFLYDAAIRTMILHSPEEVYPGPYTYKRFWFRDAALIANAMLLAGMEKRVDRILRQFPARQRPDGYFLSQEGEWDANGEALWILGRARELGGRRLTRKWFGPVKRGAEWILRKRVPPEEDVLHSGLLPAGFSAEHLGNNDYYLWDDFWAVGGLQMAAHMMRDWGEPALARRYRGVAESMMACIEDAVAETEAMRKRPAFPASPYRRMDAGAVGSLAAGFPLQLVAARDPRLLDTADYLLDECFVRGGFFQNMIHAGINAYLTLHVAQVLLRGGDARFQQLIQGVADLASPTGQWPEAIHPLGGGGCMGDGQHVWAAAEWVAMMRHLFVREEGNRLLVGEGLFPEWLESGQPISFGPTPTRWGPLTVRVEPIGDQASVQLEKNWKREPNRIDVRLGPRGHRHLWAPDAGGMMRLPLPERAG